MSNEHIIYAALDYLRRRNALPKLQTDCITIGLNAPLILRKGYNKKKTNK